MNLGIDEYITSSEAAQLINKAPSMIARLCQTEKLPGAKKIGKTWLIPRESVLNYSPERGRPKSHKAKLSAELGEIRAAAESGSDGEGA